MLNFRGKGTLTPPAAQAGAGGFLVVDDDAPHTGFTPWLTVSPSGNPTVTQAPPPLARGEIHASAIPIERAQAPGHVGQAMTLVRHGHGDGWQPHAVVLNFHAHLVPLNVRRDPDITGTGFRSQTVLHGILHQGL